ncbi:hypothetical protein FA95DRAFT_1606160 [Auriscalpium vulgare]|uniref:Uncharacterized protein n=1 Tax=Auriscalpium vulgare TaxID=40419 RepID=A0ACB8RU80_9AGAM|nr:hypothetical protein FA95DRAFT_1606160 [Auriscalpium vulgare]
MPPKTSRRTGPVLQPNPRSVDDVDAEAAEAVLFEHGGYIVIRHRDFLQGLCSLSLNALEQHSLEAPLYGVVNHVVNHLCLTISLDGATVSTHPQPVFGTDLDPDSASSAYRSRCSPDFGTIKTFCGAHGRLPFKPSSLAQLTVYWETKKSPRGGDWRVKKDQKNCVNWFWTAFPQLRAQAMHAFSHYPAEKYLAFMNVGFYVSAVIFFNPQWGKSAPAKTKASDPSEQEAGPSRIAGVKRPRVDSAAKDTSFPLSGEDITFDIQFICEPMLLGGDDTNKWADLRVNPLLLHFLNTVLASPGASIQPSFMSSDGYQVPAQVKARVTKLVKLQTESKLLQDAKQKELEEAPITSPAEALSVGNQSYEQSRIVDDLDRSMYFLRGHQGNVSAGLGPQSSPVVPSSRTGGVAQGAARGPSARGAFAIAPTREPSEGPDRPEPSSPIEAVVRRREKSKRRED